MLELEIPATEQWDEKNQEFVYSEKQTLCLAHSLISLSKWESKWHKPYLSSRNLTKEEAIDYVRCMTINKVKDDRVYYLITPKMFEKINDYISDPMSATYFNNKQERGSNQKIVSELIYYWMISLGIPFECEKWHLNRLMALIKVCQRKSGGGHKMSASDINARNAAINKARRAKMGSKG